jgi:quaternary ammonium compound-resistance protein SugE
MDQPSQLIRRGRRSNSGRLFRKMISPTVPHCSAFLAFAENSYVRTDGNSADGLAPFVCCRIARSRVGDRAKYTEGFSRLYPSIATVAAIGASIGLLSLALKSIPLGTAYAVWTGIGAAGTVALGIYLFSEPATGLRLICIGLILAGIVGLRISS